MSTAGPEIVVDDTAVEMTPEQEKLARQIGKKIPLVEMFGPTVQGEGSVIGQQTYFLRFGLCDYRCTMCDSLHAVLPERVRMYAKWLTQRQIFDEFQEFRKPTTTDWVTFSGGNPAMHDLSYLLGLLKMAHLKVNVETQGTIYQGWLSKVDSLTISPKGPGMGEKHNHEQFMGFINKVHQANILSAEGAIPWWPKICIKIVVFDQRDLEFATEIFEDLSNHDLFLSEDLSEVFYLSLGNPNPPNPNPDSPDQPTFSIREQLVNYKMLYEDIQNHPVLSKVRFLPQWHAFVWGNDAGH